MGAYKIFFRQQNEYFFSLSHWVLRVDSAMVLLFGQQHPLLSSCILWMYIRQINKECMESCNAWKSVGTSTLVFVFLQEVIKTQLVFIIFLFYQWFHIPFALSQHHHRQYYFLNSQSDSNFCSFRIYTLAFILDYYNITFY